MDKRIVFLGSLFCFGNIAAHAQENPWYAGGRIGATLYDDLKQTGGSDDIKKDNDFAGGVFLGYGFNDWFGLETGYTYLGEMEIDNASSISTHALEVVGKFTWAPSDSFDVFLKAGAYGYKSKGHDSLSGLKDKDVDGTVGVGIEKYFNDDFSVRLEYQFYNNATLDDGAYDSKWDTHLLALGLVYHWGGHKQAAVTEAPVTQVAEKPMNEVVEQPAVVAAPVVVAEKTSMESGSKTVEVYFDLDKPHLTEASIEQLKPIIEHLNAYPASSVVLVGHADSSGSAERNQILSEKRAQTVSEFLQQEYDISSDRIQISGSGEADPIASNDTKEGRAKNRRVSVHSPSVTVIEK